MKDPAMEIEPLHDDVLERHPFWGVKHLGFIDLKGWLLHKSIKRQLKARPEVWGVGLWPDEQLEAAAKKIAQIFKEEYGMPNRFVPDDPFRFIGGYRDDLEPCEVVMAIEEEFDCKLPDELFDKEPVLVMRKHGREYIWTNILRFLLPTLAGVYLLNRIY